MRGFYSITSSTRASSVGGIVNPSALAVLRLMISSAFVCWTGGSRPIYHPGECGWYRGGVSRSSSVALDQIATATGAPQHQLTAAAAGINRHQSES
jgi:hypothetical protein